MSFPYKIEGISPTFTLVTLSKLPEKIWKKKQVTKKEIELTFSEIIRYIHEYYKINNIKPKKIRDIIIKEIRGEVRRHLKEIDGGWVTKTETGKYRIQISLITNPPIFLASILRLS